MDGADILSRATLSAWRPSLSELTAPFRQPRPWTVSLEHYRKGIDNAHVDVLLSPRLRERLRETVRKLILEDVRSICRRVTQQLVTAEDLDSFRQAYLEISESTLERARAGGSTQLVALLQVALLKCLLQTVANELVALQDELKSAASDAETRAAGKNLELHEQSVALNRDANAIGRRVLHLLFRQIRKQENGHLKKLRAAVVGEPWPLPENAFTNPVLLIPSIKDARELAQDYAIAALAEGGDTDWLYQTNQCVSKVFQHYLPAFTQEPYAHRHAGTRGAPGRRERRDQGLLRGFLEVEILLSRFVPAKEYQTGQISWLDEPENLRLFLYCADIPGADADHPDTERHAWMQPGWGDFQAAVSDELYRCLDIHGLSWRVVLLYWLPTIRSQLGRPIPFSLVTDFIDGRLPRRRLAQRVEGLRLGLDCGATARVLERTASELKRLTQAAVRRYLDRYLIDFLALRRDLKLAYKTYETMDGIRLLDEPAQVRLSRSNGSLIEFPCRGESGPVVRRIRAHAVIKADVRGSTRITESLRAMGLNPASHFSLNFFDPVNKLLPDYGAEKLFVEGDAVILAIFEYDETGSGMAVARACGLARKILQVVALQNVLNRKHGLPELELGLGIAYEAKEPNFLYDEGHRIMISSAINRADRLCACSSGLRRATFAPESSAFRVAVVRDAGLPRHPARGDDLLNYNVNGIKLEETAFFKLQKETRLRQVRLPEEDIEHHLFFAGRYPDIAGRNHWVVVRYGPVREWDGQTFGEIDPERRHYFEVIVDEALTTRVRKRSRPGPV